MAGPSPRVQCRRIISALLLSTLVAFALLASVRAPGPVGADTVTTLQAQARVVAQKLVEEQLQVGAYQQQYSVASARTAAESQAIAQIGRQVTQDQQAIDARTSLVRTEAIRAYTDYGSGTTGVDDGLFGGNEEQVQAASEYDSIAVGTITTAVDQLQTARRTLQSQESELRRQQHQDQVDQGHEATVLGQADSTEQQLTALNAQVTGQLATAVAQQASAQAAAAAAAVAAAQRAAVHSAPAPVTTTSEATTSGATAVSGASGPTAGAGTTTTTTPPTGTTPTSIPDPALNPFLQCVVQAESGGDYGAVSPNGLYMGAFQFSQPTWNTAAAAAGLGFLVGVPPNQATKAEQDTVAVALYALDGDRPWLGDRCS